ncbi:SPOR domain-containing protein [Tenacibaculum sp. UWU-22]|uniref:SPOR domain-containing protein n=1 Tax=Tenacibaculum sp. UWU-22 TaxID=3234187 RepID=UPI0034DB16A8
MLRNKGFILIFFVLFFSGIGTVSAQYSYSTDRGVDSLLIKKRIFNKNNGLGYRIQLYNGLEKKARSVKADFETQFPGVYTKLIYDSPEWKIQVGNYKNRLEADRALNKIKEKFYGAIVIPL